MACNETVVQYITKIENLAYQITETCESISDATVIVKILGKLCSKYRNFRQAWLSVDDSKPNLSNLFSAKEYRVTKTAELIHMWSYVCRWSKLFYFNER